MNTSNTILKTIIAVLLAALAGTPIAHAQSKKIRIRIEYSTKRDSIALDSMMKKMESALNKLEGIEVERIKVEFEIPENHIDTYRLNSPNVQKITRIKPVTRELHHYFGYLHVQNSADLTIQTTPGGTVSNGMPELNTTKSIHYGLEQLWGINLIKGKLRFFTGIRYDVFNFRFQSNFVRLTENAPTFQATTVGGVLVDPIPMDKSKLVAHYVGIPLAIGYQSGPGRWQSTESDGSNTDHWKTPKFSIKAGIHTGYLVSAHVKLKESRGHTTKQYDDFNLNNFILSPFLNVEYEDVGLYVRYPLTNIFKARQGANSQCLQFGITLKFT